jgi:hypothetical protein
MTQKCAMTMEPSPEFKRAFKPPSQNSPIDFLLDTYKSITNVYAAGAGLPVPFPPSVPDPLCEGYWPMGGTGEHDIPCLEPTVKCPVCGEESGACAEHLFHCDECNKDMCPECVEAVGGWPCKGCEQTPEGKPEPSQPIVPQNTGEDFGGQHRFNPRTQAWEPEVEL